MQEFPHDRLRATPFVKPFQLPSEFLEDVLTSPDYRRFAVVRDPASRVLSAYLEKIRQGLKQSAAVVEALKESTGRDIAPEDITFEEFLSVVAAQTSRQQDSHWRRQADHIGLGIIDYDAVIHLEQLDASWAQVAELTSTPGLQEQYFCRNSTAAASKVGEYYTPELRRMVADTYARDYAELGYSLPV